jgi:hypothetical protein
MSPPPNTALTAFDGDRRIAAGDLHAVARAAKHALDRHREASILIFDDATSGPVDLDFRGSIDDVLARLPMADSAAQVSRHAEAEVPTTDSPTTDLPANRGPGRPKLGVVAREITLLPRHWEWLAGQKGGASVAIRRLVDEARRRGEDADRIRKGQEAAYRFMSAMAGNRPHFEDAIRALFAPDPLRFEELIAGWPADVRDHASQLAARAFRANSLAPAG